MEIRHNSSNFSIFRILFLIVVAVVIIFAVDFASNYQQSSHHRVAASVLPQGTKFFAMGDSYSAGGGSDHTPDNPATDNSAYKNSPWKCYRSDRTAQNILTKKMSLQLIDTTCSGAKTEHILSENQGDMPPQLTKLEPDTKLVTIIIGANDTELMSAVTCIQSEDCANSELMTTLMESRFEKLKANIISIYTKVHETAPNAKIRHAGYPYVISPPGEPTENCSEWLTEAEQVSFDNLLIGTNETIRSTVEEFAERTGIDIQYIDPLANGSPFMKRIDGKLLEGCSSSNKRYMNGPQDGPDGLWHPNLYGQQHYAELYQKSL